jgi:hypothetical protein
LKWSSHGLATVTLLPRLAGTFYSVSAGVNAESAAEADDSIALFDYLQRHELIRFGLLSPSRAPSGSCGPVLTGCGWSGPFHLKQALGTKREYDMMSV